MKDSARTTRILCGVIVILIAVLAVLTVIIFISKRVNASPTVDTSVPFSVTDEDGSTQIFERPEPENAEYNILCCGRDVATGLPDTVLILHIKAENGNICAVQLPRDTFIECNGAEMKLNALIANLGTGEAARYLEKALCIKIDFYVSFPSEAFISVVDAVGGVEIDVPFDMDYEDPYQDLYIHLKTGVQTLDGRDALSFVRYRSGYSDGDLGRLDAQKKFMSAMLKTVREKLNLSSATKIINEVFPKVKTDMSLDDCTGFAKIVLSHGKSAEGLVMLTAPGRALNTEKTSYYVLGREAMLSVVNERLNVYTSQISDSMFDASRIFVRDGDDNFERIYTYSIISVETEAGQ